ncbi:MAG TPA: SpoIIE family protein phosphatase [Acidobacteriota bacterium]
MIKVVLVDDEELARERLRSLLGAFDDIQIVGEAQDGSEAVEKIASARPDLVFMDVEMPGRNGMDVVTSLPAPRPRIIFCTAYDRYAIEAFEQHAVDYLLKPVSRPRLAKSMERIRALQYPDDVLHRLKSDLETARQVQAGLFPQDFPTARTLKVSARCKSAGEVGGDYYDFFKIAEELFCFAIADAAGKSVPGALLMANLQGVLRSQAPQFRHSIADLVSAINQQMCASTDSNKYAALFCAYYDDVTRILTAVNAGHVPPLLFRAAGAQGRGISDRESQPDQIPMRLEAGGTALGMFKDAGYQEIRMELKPGDLLLMATDGICEAMNPRDEEFGEARLVDEISRNRSLPLDELSAQLLGAVSQFTEGAPQHDDITLVMAEIR